MNLFERLKRTKEPTTDPSLYVPEQPVASSRIDWKRAIPRLAVLIIVVALLVFGGLRLFGVFDKEQPASKNNGTATTQTSPGQPSGESKQKSTSPPSSNSGKHDASGGQTGKTSPTTTGSSSQSSVTAPPATNQLANSGPGDTAVLFLIVSAISAVGYHAVLRLRLRNQA